MENDPPGSDTAAAGEARQKRRWPEGKWEFYGTVIAALIGLMALLVSAYTAYLQRVQTRAMVWPRLEISRYRGHVISVRNTGLGPALIKRVRVTFDGRPIKMWKDIVVALGLSGPSGHTTLHNRVVQPGELVEAFDTPDNESGRALFRSIFFDNEKRIDMQICFCSVLGQCWLTGSNDDENPTPEIDQCPIPAADRFAQ